MKTIILVCLNGKLSLNYPSGYAERIVTKLCETASICCDGDENTFVFGVSKTQLQPVCDVFAQMHRAVVPELTKLVA